MLSLVFNWSIYIIISVISDRDDDGNINYNCYYYFISKNSVLVLLTKETEYFSPDSTIPNTIEYPIDLTCFSRN